MVSGGPDERNARRRPREASDRTSARRLRGSRRGLLGWIILLVILAAVAFLLPLPFPYSGSLLTKSPAGFGTDLNESFPNGAEISGSWSAPGAVPVLLTISTASGAMVYEANGTGGAYSFTSNGGDYEFSAVSPAAVLVSVHGTSDETIVQYLDSLL